MLVATPAAHAQSVLPVCERTEQVRDGIVEAIDGVTGCADVTNDHLSELRGALYLDGRNIESLKAGDFSGLGNLESLHLSGNQLGNQLDDEPELVFSDLMRLKTLDLSGNRLTTLWLHAFIGLSNLESLHLSGNQLDGVPELVFSGLVSLKTLDLSRNQLSVLSATVFSGLGSLKTLDLSRNQLSAVPSAAFSGLRSLQTLYLGNNRLAEDSLSGTIFSDLAKLETLDLSNNQLTALSLPTGVFSDLTTLKRLDLSSNQLSSLPLDVFSPTFSPLGHRLPGPVELEAVWLSSNVLTTLPDNVFSNLDKLRSLYLNQNRLASLPPDVFSGLLNLEELWLNANELSALPATVFSDLVGLRWLFLDQNELGALPPTVFSGLDNLRWLFLSNNQLSTLPPTVFSGADDSGLPNLERLYLGGNQLSALTETVFSSLGSLRELSLRSNRLSALPATVFSGLDRLGVLWLSSNVLTVLPDDVFSGLSGLGQLYLFGNQLSALPDGVFSGLGNLRWLDLHGNGLSDLPANTFSGLLKLNVLNLAGNPGVPFVFARSRLVRVGRPGLPRSGTFKLVLDQVAPATITMSLSVEGGESSVAETVISAGNTESEPFTVTQDEDASVVTLSASAGTLTGYYSGVETAASELVVDLIGPSVSGVTIISRPAFGDAYQASSGEEIQVAIIFDQAINVSYARLTLTIGETPRIVGYDRVEAFEGVAASTLVFAYTLRADDVDKDGISVGPDALAAAIALKSDTSITLQSTSLRSYEILNAAGHRVIPNSGLSFDASAGLIFEVEEGGVVDLRVTLSSTTDTHVVVGYEITADADPGTADADISDYSGPGFGSVTVEANERTTVLSIRINDDDEVEPARESFVVSLMSVAGYDPVFPATVLVVVKEGVCDRTPQVRDEILERIGDSGNCADASDDDLSGIRVLASTGITAISPGDFSGLDNLETLWLRSDESLVLQGDVFSELVNLRRLDLHQSGLTVLPPGVFSGLGSLEELWLSSNRLTVLPPGLFSGLANLRRLFLGHNGLISLQPTVFSGLPNLERLHLDSNQLSTLPDGVFSGLGNLRELSLGSNILSALSADVFSGLGNLEALYLGGNQLASLPEGVFSGLGNLEALYLGGNQLASLPEGVFSGLGNLEALYLGGNQLASLPEGVFSGLGNLKSLYLFSNELNILPLVLFAPLASLEGLYLFDNQLTSLQPLGFSRLSNLQELNLSGNQLGNQLSNQLDPFRGFAFSGLSNLQKLHLSSNQLTSLSATIFSSLTGLKELHLSSNQLTNLPADIFSSFTGLQALHLSSNRLTTLPANIFSPFTGLQELHLSSNRLTTLPEGIFSGLVSNLRQLRLQGNPGAPFVFIRPALVLLKPGDSTAKLTVDVTVPTTITVGLSAEGGEVSVTEAVIPEGGTESDSFTVTQATAAPATLTASTGTLAGRFHTGVETAASELVVDVVAPSVLGVEIISRPDFGAAYLASFGEVIRVEVDFDEAVEVSATTDGPSLTLTIGATMRTAAYAPSLSQATTLVFVYELQVGDADENGISIEDDALMLADAEITDLSGNRIASTRLGIRAIMDAAEHRVIEIESEFEISFDETDDLGLGRVVAGGDPRRVSVMLGNDLDEVEVRLSSDVPGGGLTITPDSFRLSAGSNVRQLELTAGPQARGPLDADGAIGPAELTAEVFPVNDGTLASTSFSTTTSMAVDVRFYVDISYLFSGVQSTALTLVAQHPDKGLDDVDVSLVSDNERWPSQLASGERFEGRLVRESGPADDELFIDTFEIEEGGDVAIAIDVTLVSPQSTLLGTSFWRAKWIGSRGVSYAPGYEPEVSSNLFQVNVVGSIQLSLEISSTRIRIEPGGSTQITLTTDPRLELSEEVAVTLQAPAGSGVQFNGQETQRITLDVGNQTEEVTVSALNNARPGVHRITVTTVPNGGLVFPSLPEMTVQAGALGIRLHDAQAAEGEVAEVRLTLDEPSPLPMTLNYSTGVSSVPGTDNADRDDFTDLNNGVVTVPAGESSTFIRIRIEDDEVIEPLRETFQVRLLDHNIPDGYAIVPVPAVVTIKEGVCDRTEQVGDAIVSAVGVASCADVDDADLSGVSSLSVETFDVESLQDRDLAGLVGLRDLDFSEGRGFADLQDLSGSVFSDLGGLESLDFGRNNLGGGDLPSTVFQSLVNLRSLDLSDNKLTSLPPGIFAGLIDLRHLDLSDNPGLSDPPDPLNPLACPPTGLPAGIFAGLDSLSTLVLHRTNVRFCLEFEQVSNPSPNDGVRAYRLSVALGAPYQFTLGLAAEGGSVSTESVTIAVGSTHSGTFTVTQAGNAPLTLTHDNEDAIEDETNGVEFAAAPELKLDERAPEVTSLLFYSSPDADGIYQEDSDIKIAVLFDEAVRVTNMGTGLHLQLHSRGTSFAIGYDADATGVAHDADSAAADNHELVFSSAPLGVPAGTSGPESGFSIEQDMLLIHNAPQATTITDLAGNPASASLNGRDISTREYRLRFDPAALRTVAGSDEDERTLRTLHLEALSGSIRLPAGDEVTIAFDPAPGDVAGVSVHAPDDDALLDDGTGQPGLTFTRTEPSRSVRVRVDGAANRLEGGGTAGGVTFVEASLSRHSRSSRGDEGLRVVPASLLVGVVPLEVAPTPDVPRYRVTFNNAPSVVVDAGRTRSLGLSQSPSGLPGETGVTFWRVTVSYEGQDGVTASYPQGSRTNFLQNVRLTAPQDARGELGILTARASLGNFSNPALVRGAEITPAVIAVRVRPFQEFPAMRKYALAFDPDPLGVLVGEAKTVTLTLLDPDDTLLGSDLVTVTLGLRGGTGTIDPETLTLSASDRERTVSVTVDAADAFAGVDRSLWLTAEAAPVEGLQVGAAQLAVTASQPTFELVFDPSRPLTVPRGGATKTTSLRLSEAEGVALPPVGTRLSVPVSLSLGGDGVHLTPSQAVLTAEVDAQGVTAQAVEVEVRAESTAPQQSLVLVAEPDQSDRSVRLISAALPVNVTPPVRQFGFEFEGTGSHALGGGNPGFFFVPGVPLGYLGVSPDRRLFVRGTPNPPPHCGSPTDQPGNPGGCAGLASGLFRLTGDELAEGERVTATLTWYISEAGSPGDLLASWKRPV